MLGKPEIHYSFGIAKMTKTMERLMTVCGTVWPARLAPLTATEQMVASLHAVFHQQELQRFGMLIT